MSTPLAGRRNLLIGATALPFGWRNVDTSVEHPDANLLAMCAKAQAHDEESARLYDTVGDLPASDLHRKAVLMQSDAHLALWDDLVSQIIVTPAQTMDGLRAKAAMAKGMVLLNADGEPSCDDRLAWSLACDVLAGSALVG